MLAKGDTCTRELGFVCFNIAPHFHACSRATCKSLRCFDAPERGFLRNPDPWASDRLPPRLSSDGGSPVYPSIVLCLFRS